jgi:hypothetical protein
MKIYCLQKLHEDEWSLEGEIYSNDLKKLERIKTELEAHNNWNYDFCISEIRLSSEEEINHFKDI